MNAGVWFVIPWRGIGTMRREHGEGNDA
jgi:hypothetical protein